MVAFEHCRQHMPTKYFSKQSLDMSQLPCLLRCVCYLGFGWTLGNYSALNWFFLGGLLGPFAVWLLHKAFPNQSWIPLINLPVLLGATGYMPPATTLNYTSWILVGTVFNFFIFRYRKKWWQRYNYILSAALDAGVAFMAVLLYFSLGMENRNLHWWGSNPDIDLEHCELASCPTSKGISVDGCPIF
jgi:hypothetical protein